MDSQSYNAVDSEVAGPSVVYHEEGLNLFRLFQSNVGSFDMFVLKKQHIKQVFHCYSCISFPRLSLVSCLLESRRRLFVT